jgi:hypothetical protein
VANDELNGRTILATSFDFARVYRGPTEGYRLNSAMPALANAVAEACDLYEVDGRIVVLSDGELRILTTSLLAQAIRKNLVRKGLRHVADGKLERTYLPVTVNEVVLRMLLTDEKYGLLGRVSAPMMAEEAQPEAAVEPPVWLDPQRALEAARGAQVLARFANPDAQRELEAKRGAQRVAEVAAEMAQRRQG